MRILILANNDVGLYNFRKELLQSLLDLQHLVYISLPYGKMVDKFVEMGCRFIEVPLERHGMNLLNELKLCISYKNILKKLKPDVVLSYTVKPNIYGGYICGKLGIPVIANITGLGSAVENGGFIQKIIVDLYKVSMRNVHTIFFQNQANMNYFRNKNISKIEKYRLIPGSGVNLRKFEILPYPEDDKKVEFVFISRIMKEKGIDHYFEAAEFIKKKYPNTVFHVCGFFEQDYEKIIQDLQERGIIIYHGMVRDIRPLFKFIHCIIHPSYHEGMANAILEAAACGRPCLCSDIPGCQEAVEDGKTGFLFQSKSTQALTCVIEKFLNLSYEQKKNMGMTARKKMEAEFDRRIVVSSYMTEINNILEDKNE